MNIKNYNQENFSITSLAKFDKINADESARLLASSPQTDEINGPWLTILWDAYVNNEIVQLETINNSENLLLKTIQLFQTAEQPNEILETLFDFSIVQFALIFIFVSLFFKLSLAPFHLWTPDVYEGSPSSSSFFFAVVSKLGVFILLVRIAFYAFPGFIDSWRYYVILIAIFSVLVGSFVGLEQKKFKSLLAYSTIGHMGYSLLAFSTGTLEGFQMLYFYLIIYMLSNLSIWTIFMLLKEKTVYSEKHNKELGSFVLLNKSNSYLAFFLTITLFSIAGLPPFIGFVAKSGIFLVLVESSLYFAALISILCSVISTFFYLRIIKLLYFEKVLVGRLYYPIENQNAVVVVLLLLSFIYFFISPSLIYLLTYKISLSMFLV